MPRAADIAAFLARTEVADLPEGDHPIDGDDLFVRVLRYETPHPAAGRFETHHRYTDVQVLVEGEERMLVAPPEGLDEAEPYDAVSDFHFFTSRAAEPTGESTLLVTGGMFVVFFPGEPHQPGLRHGPDASSVLKLVFKVRRA